MQPVMWRILHTKTIKLWGSLTETPPNYVVAGQWTTPNISAAPIKHEAWPSPCMEV